MEKQAEERGTQQRFSDVQAEVQQHHPELLDRLSDRLVVAPTPQENSVFTVMTVRSLKPWLKCLR